MSTDLAVSCLRPLASPEVQRLVDSLREDRGADRCVPVTGLPGPAKALCLLGLHQALRRSLTVLVRSDDEAELLVRDLQGLASAFGLAEPAELVLFPSLDADPYQGIAPHLSRVTGRVRALAALAAGECAILVVPVEALFTPLQPPGLFAAWCRSVRTGSEWAEADDPGWLDAAGYERVDVVGAPGEFARRGGVLDLFPPGEELPVRIELDGDRVASMRRFDPAEQRSTGEIAEVRITPGREIPLGGGEKAALSRALTNKGEAAHRLIGMLEHQGRFPGVESCARLALRETVTVLDHAAGHLVCLDEPEMTREEALNLRADFLRSHEASPGSPLPKPEDLFVPEEEIEEILTAKPRLTLRHLKVHDEEAPEGTEVLELPAAGAGSYRGRMSALLERLGQGIRQGEVTCLLMSTPGTTRRMGEILQEAGVGFLRLPQDAAVAPGGGGGAVFLATGSVSAGFSFPSSGWHLVTEHEIFGTAPVARKRTAAASFASDFRDLRLGDLVVHVDHGIGRYDGLTKVTSGKSEVEVMLLTYLNDDRLYVPMERLDLIHKYSGTGDKPPALDRLGGQSWARTRRKVAKAMEAMAAELLELYAARKTVEGYAHPADTEWQQEFESAFPYTPTPDQVRAIGEVKKDMEKPAPMDRLLCGDVGFGKTEVALRATFKAVMGGRQVAVLAPTTVLAFQHLRTFSERFAPFPVQVAMMSRLRSAREQAETAARVAGGDVDILVGTHRILSKDIEFQNLGLLIVDEEQRFGVKAKERIKQLKKAVDVLTLTATPIPRTLQMAMGGVVDLSLVETPPESRLAIQTHLVPFKESIIAPAVRHELQRGGQVYFVHNRVDTIDTAAGLIRRLVPEAKIAVAHGQMGKGDLEKTMMRFVRGEADVLVSTTIIENGLDIPRVNTLIVNRADRFGLAQLYQLRGRIGRSDRQAYAYLLVPPHQTLTPTARRRLQALQDFTDLGSGFRIAAMDLEIRGAGELLGPRQHGHIAAVGFEMYCQMLERAVEEMKGGAPLPEFRTQINVGADLRLPGNYVREEGLRLVLYRKVASARSAGEIDAVRDEMEDRFGRMPPSAERLLDAARLRLLAARMHVLQVDYANDALMVKFAPTSPLDPARLMVWIREHTGASLTPSGLLKLPAGWPREERIARALEILRTLA
ncbi:MAG TPA: transcription-repair coupling factor [Candidatus Saccharimonadales bacterium]|nr:transcription-repair coupling factor [Candidatus Saccharimonadales bacterium]